MEGSGEASASHTAFLRLCPQCGRLYPNDRSACPKDRSELQELTDQGVVVNGKYVTDVGMAGGEDKLFQVINALVAKEKPQG